MITSKLSCCVSSAASRPLRRHAHVVAVEAQDVVQQQPDALLVVDHEDAAAADRRRQADLGGGATAAAFRLALLAAAQGQVDVEDGAARGQVLRPDAAAVLVDDAVADRQAEPGALARLLRREEGVEDAALRCRAECRGRRRRSRCGRRRQAARHDGQAGRRRGCRSSPARRS